MKKLGLLFMAFLALVLPLVGCAAETKARLGQQFSLSIGQTAIIEGENLKIKFLDVVGDSRCPRGATCIWQGEAKCNVTFTLNSDSKEMVLTEPGLSNPPFQQTFRDYQIAFSLTPYPEVGKKISPSQYRLLLTLSK